MHRAAAATIPMTIPVVLLDSRTTSEGPGSRLTPGSVGGAVGILWNIGEVINGPLSLVLSTSKDVGNGSNIKSGWGFSLCLFWPAFLAGALWKVAAEAEVAVVRLWSAVSGMVVAVVLLLLKIDGLFSLKVLDVSALLPPSNPDVDKVLSVTK